MAASRVPNVLKNAGNSSLTLTYQRSRCSLLWMHGVGDIAASYVSFFGHLQSPIYHQIRVKLLQADSRFLTLNHSQSPAWFDIKSQHRLSLPESQIYDLEELEVTKKLLGDYCREEEQYWRQQQKNETVHPQHKIFIGGYGQGAIAALHYGLQSKQIPAGIIAVDGCLLRHTSTDNLGKLPILILQNKQRGLLSEVEARTTYSRILQKSDLVQYEPYQSENEGLSVNELILMRKWMERSYSFIQQHYKAQKSKQ